MSTDEQYLQVAVQQTNVLGCPPFPSIRTSGLVKQLSEDIRIPTELLVCDSTWSERFQKNQNYSQNYRQQPRQGATVIWIPKAPPNP